MKLGLVLLGACVVGGTLGLLAAALLTPRPPGLLVLNEPETGLHGPVLGPLASLMAEAAGHAQLVVTTHSADLADRLAALGGRLEVTSQISVEPILSANRVELPWGAFTSTVLSVRNTYTMTPRMFMSALVQYNSSTHSLSTNARLRWEYQPGSELFVVYTEGRSTLPQQGTALESRGFVVKVNRLFRF